jgi:uncharacterized membrane protein YebE (DUF533 family)
VVALTVTAVAAGIVAKAKFALNTGKLQGSIAAATIAYIERRYPRGQNTARSKRLREALPRTQPLPTPRARTDDDLTVIEASLAQAY